MLKIFHAISKMPKLTVASNVSRARVSKSVMKHHPPSLQSVGGTTKMFAFPTQGRKGIDRLPYVDSTFKRQYNRRFLLFQQREVSVFFLLDRTACTGYTEKQKNMIFTPQEVLPWKTLTNC